MAASLPTSSNVAQTNTKNVGFAGSVIAAYTKPLRSSRIVGIGHTDAQGPASTANAPSSPTIGRQRINSAAADHKTSKSAVPARPVWTAAAATSGSATNTTRLGSHLHV